MNDVLSKKGDAKPVLHPLTKEEKRKRAETRRHNRELQQEQNGGIRVLLKDCLPGLVSHKHISHFRTDLHRHIDKVMFLIKNSIRLRGLARVLLRKGKEVLVWKLIAWK
jgi:hypothetical protein